MDTRDIAVMRSKSSFFMDLTGELKRNELRAPWLNKMLTKISTSLLLSNKEKEVLTSAMPINHVFSNAIVKGFVD
ncbi:hypothetical protein U8V72_21250 [Priestia filamentosa]|uniref:hypothetical protein n=1 Tax=Priestia filamentosa TaxID=1402861 RepID=UPI00397DF2CE